YTNAGLSCDFCDFLYSFVVCADSSCILTQFSSFGIGIDGKLSSIATVTTRRMCSLSWNISNN
ncbi:unnamed protein product, partial [Rotaria sp. Silwood2]